MARPKRRYVRNDEVKCKDKMPEDGQLVAFRVSGHKTYYRGTYRKETQTFDTESGSSFDKKFIQGWVPRKT